MTLNACPNTANTSAVFTKYVSTSAARLSQQHQIRKEITCNYLVVSFIWSARRWTIVVCRAFADVPVTKAGRQRPRDVEACSLMIEDTQHRIYSQCQKARLCQHTISKHGAGRPSFASFLFRLLQKCVFDAWVQPVHTAL